VRALLAVLLFAGCTTPRSSDRAASDVEIERAVLWEFRRDRKFQDVRIRCRDRVVVLAGAVATPADRDEAVERARKAAHAQDYGAQVRDELEIRAK
jgi:osmotically-inducible protein OsmY